MIDTSGASARVEKLIFDRLTAADLPDSVEDIVIASLLGDNELDTVLGPGNLATASGAPDNRR